MDEVEELRGRVAELERLVAALADRVYAAHEVLANLAERKRGKGDGGD